MDQDNSMNPESLPETPVPAAENTTAEAPKPKRRGRPPRQKTPDKAPEANEAVPAPAAAAEPARPVQPQSAPADVPLPRPK